MSIPKVTILGLLSISVFFIVHMFYTQKIYLSNLRPFLIFSIIFPVILILLSLDQSRNDLFKIIPFGSTCLVYYFLLRLLKANYTALNNFFIQKKWLHTKYANKDFTFVHLGDGRIADFWDEKMASNPSWFDKFITFLLFALPILIAALIITLLTAIF
jgi:hypothetical protein